MEYFKYQRAQFVRTNNCLERYNRHLNDLFANAHPNLVVFIAEIKKDEEYYSNMMRSIRSRSMKLLKTQKEFTKQTLPINYINFKLE
ncbi:LOW QUALITY PROTEIN: hypothetical protein MXB_787 [Myxobolus squamalis]|nr:LOW QUALITY PROTEIN: hypothetical protein MXB_787 [Myxobolus squamalis]